MHVALLFAPLSALSLAPTACAPATRSAPGPAAPDTDPSGGGTDSADGTEPAPQAGDLLLEGARLPGASTPTSLLLSEGRIVALDPERIESDVEVVDLSGRWLAPAFIDSHVHLAYLPEAPAMLDGGVVAAVDLAAPIDALAEPLGAMQVRWAGPMVTAVGGYPTQSWGRDGYGTEVTTADQAAAAVATLTESGASVIKVPLGGSPGLTDAALAAAVSAAHDRGLPVAAHALDDASAARAAAFDVDVLAHLPTRPLSADTVAAWSGRAVVPTLAAFGGGADTLANLSALHDAGARVLYGTDFGNTRTPGIQAAELRAMRDAGLSSADILAAGTSTPAAFWGFDGLGALAVGARASLLVLDADPLSDPLSLADPVQVWVDGVRR